MTQHTLPQRWEGRMEILQLRTMMMKIEKWQLITWTAHVMSWGLANLSWVALSLYAQPRTHPHILALNTLPCPIRTTSFSYRRAVLYQSALGDLKPGGRDSRRQSVMWQWSSALGVTSITVAHVSNSSCGGGKDSWNTETLQLRRWDFCILNRRLSHAFYCPGSPGPWAEGYISAL